MRLTAHYSDMKICDVYTLEIDACDFHNVRDPLVLNWEPERISVMLERLAAVARQVEEARAESFSHRPTRIESTPPKIRAQLGARASDDPALRELHRDEGDR